MKVKSLSRIQLFATPWTVAHQAPPSMEFSRQEYWSWLLFPPPGNLLDPGIKPRSPELQADALLSEPPGKPIKRKKSFYTWLLIKICLLVNCSFSLNCYLQLLYPAVRKIKCCCTCNLFQDSNCHHFMMTDYKLFVVPNSRVQGSH